MTMHSMEKIAFVTGGSGSLGQKLVAALIARGFRVRALARTQRSVQTVEQLGAEAVTGSLADAAALRQGMRGADLVIHCAALMGQQHSFDAMYRDNVVGTDAVLEAA